MTEKLETKTGRLPALFDLFRNARFNFPRIYNAKKKREREKGRKEGEKDKRKIQIDRRRKRKREEISWLRRLITLSFPPSQRCIVDIDICLASLSPLSLSGSLSPLFTAREKACKRAGGKAREGT